MYVCVRERVICCVYVFVCLSFLQLFTLLHNNVVAVVAFVVVAEILL